MVRLRVEKIEREVADTATFYLRPVDGSRLHYQAGQFLTLVFDHHNTEIRRSYSISSSPDEELVAVTVKRVTNGELSRYLLIYPQVGDVWQAVEPTGKFVVDTTQNPQPIFFFAAGSGIAPIFSQIKHLLNTGFNGRLILVYSNQNQSTILFKTQLDELEQRYAKQLMVIHLLSDQGQRLNNTYIEQLVQQHAANLSNAAFYLCGPFAYMRMVRMTLIFMGITKAQIRKENFVLETVPVMVSPVGHAPRQLKIVYQGETYNIREGENQSILQAALQNNIRLPYSCKAGICSACAVRCKSGKVDVIYNEVLTDDDRAQGWILTCTGYAMDDDVVIEVD